MLPNTLKSYDIGFRYFTGSPDPIPDEATQPGAMKLVQEVVTIADPEIDFSKSNHMWVVPPPNAKRKDFIAWDLFKYSIQTQEKNIKKLYLMGNPFDYKWDLKNRSENEKKYGRQISNAIFDGSAGLGWAHYWGHSSGTFVTFGSVYGHPNEPFDWGVMTSKDTDWLALHKWILQ